MNEQKIKELVLATGLVEYDWRENMKYNSEEELVERLIEVVVRECMKVASSQRNPANLNYKPSEQFVEDLRQHFGLE